MMIEDINIDTEEIQLDQFLKWAGVLASGGEVKALLTERRSSAMARLRLPAGVNCMLEMLSRLKTWAPGELPEQEIKKNVSSFYLSKKLSELF